MNTDNILFPKEVRVICLPFSRQSYPDIVENAISFRKYVDEKAEKFPELFPKEFNEGQSTFQAFKAMDQAYQNRKI